MSVTMSYFGVQIESEATNFDFQKHYSAEVSLVKHKSMER